MNSFIAAFRFLTILPLPSFGNAAETNGSHANTPAFFPAVGLFVGTVVAGTFVGASELLPVSVAAALAIAVLVALTGALHMDGLGDSFDGLFGGRTKERKLEIMADARIGAFGVGAIILVLLTKWTAISEFDPQKSWMLLVATPIISRGLVAAFVVRFPYVRSNGIGSIYQDASAWVLPVSVILTLTLTVVFVGLTGLIALGVAALVGLGVAFYSVRVIDGVTGDVYGAVIELSELAALLTLLGLTEAEVDVGVIW